MIRSFVFVGLLLSLGVAASGQKSGRPKPGPTPAAKGVAVPVAPPLTFTSEEYKFAFKLPSSWRAVDSGFEEYLKSQGFDIGLAAPDTLSKVGKIRLTRGLERVKVLLTAFRATTTVAGNESSILRVSAEDLTLQPQIRDAVDYFDAMLAQFATMALPPDLRYSETQAEQLGLRQFAFIDISAGGFKKRLYATVRNRSAIVFALTYRNPSDLAAVRDALAATDFTRK